MAKIPTFTLNAKGSRWKKVTDLTTINNIITIVTLGLTKFSINSSRTGETILIANPDRKRKGKVYTDGRINFLGVRDDVCNDSFNDIIYVYWVEKDTKEFVCYKAENFTTKPGIASYHRIPRETSNSNGVAVMCEGWQENIWCRGKHNSKYDALRQYSSNPYTKSEIETDTIRIYRDKRYYNSRYNKKNKPVIPFIYPENVNNEKSKNIKQYNVEETGINLHRTSNESINFVGTNSAGCQVFRFHRPFEALMYIIYLKENGKFILNQDTFSYFLTNKSVFEILNKQIEDYKKHINNIKTQFDYIKYFKDNNNIFKIPYKIENYDLGVLNIYNKCGVSNIGSDIANAKTVALNASAPNTPAVNNKKK